MACNKIISNLQLLINGEIIAYVPNTLKYVQSTAENKTVPLTTGGTATKAFHSQDVSEAKGVVKFEVKATSQILANIPTWHKNLCDNTIELSSQNGEVALAYSDMSLTSQPEMEFGAEASFELEFNGTAI